MENLNPLWSVLIVGDPGEDMRLEQVDIVWVNHPSALERFRLALDWAQVAWRRPRAELKAFPFLHDATSRSQLSWADEKNAVPHVWLEKYI